MELTDKQLDALRELVDIQGYEGNWDYDEYMFGMYNGMELMLAMVEGREPKFKEKPETYRQDLPEDKSEPIPCD